MPDVIDKLNYSHEKMIDLIIASPRITQRELAARFGYTEGWISQVVRSDGFRELYAARKKEFVDPIMMQNIDTRLEALSSRCLDVLIQSLDTTANPDVALKGLEISTRALGFGAKAGINIQQNFVVAMPPKSLDSATWVEGHAPRQALPGVTAARSPQALPGATVTPVIDVDA